MVPSSLILVHALPKRRITLYYVYDVWILHGSWQKLFEEDYQSIVETLQIKILPTTLKCPRSITKHCTHALSITMPLLL